MDCILFLIVACIFPFLGASGKILHLGEILLGERDSMISRCGRDGKFLFFYINCLHVTGVVTGVKVTRFRGK